MLGMLGLAHTRVCPHVWKHRLGLNSDKEQTRFRAMQLFPGADLRRKKDHSRAEALLLEWYGC
jgi:crossover junction endodeoxyribonuclease RuvC